jgi:hypothetical protein
VRRLREIPGVPSEDALAERASIVAYLRRSANAPHPVEAGEYALSWMGRSLLLLMAAQVKRGDYLKTEEDGP